MDVLVKTLQIFTQSGYAAMTWGNILMLLVGGTLFLNTNAVYEVTLGGASAGNDYAQAIVGIFNPRGAKLNVVLTAVPVVGQQYTIIRYTTFSSLLGGKFIGDNVVASQPYNGRVYYFNVNYAGGPNNKDIVLTALASGTFIQVN